MTGPVGPALRWSMAVLLAAAVLASLLLDFRSSERSPPLHFGQAELAVVPLGAQVLVLGQHLPESAMLSLPPSLQQLPPQDSAAWHAVALPDHRARDAMLQGGRPYEVEMRWYRLWYKVPADAMEAQALHIARVIGGPVVVLARGGTASATPWRSLLDNRGEWLSQWNRPLYVPLPTDLAVPGAALQLAIGLPTIRGVQFGLSAPAVGPAVAVAALQQRRLFWQVTGMQALSLCGLLLGGLALALAWRGQQPGLNLLFAGVTAVWALRNLHYFVAPPAARTAYEWFWWTTNSSISWLTVLFYLFVLRFLPQRLPRVERGLVAFGVLLSLITLPLWPLRGEALVLQHALNVAVAAGVCLFLLWQALRLGQREFSMLAGTLLLGVVLAAHDLLLLAGRLPPDHYYLLPYCCLMLLLTFQHALVRQHAGAFVRLAGAHADQQRRLAEQQQQLQANHRRLVAFEREQALQQERQRLMRDMHDGLGSALLSSLALAQQRQLSPQAMARLLGDCIDDLRLVIDSLEPIDNDLATLLGTLRLRLGSRLEAAGLHLHWHVQDDLPTLTWLDPAHALQVLRTVQEMFTNVLKHAGARQVHVRLHHGDGHVMVEVADDGAGFDLQQPGGGGRGLANMRGRADALGARLDIDTAAGRGTRVRLLLPIERPGKATWVSLSPVPGTGGPVAGP